MKKFIIIALMCYAFAKVVEANEAREAWAVQQVLKNDRLSVELRCRSIASLSDEEWLTIRFLRHGKSDLKITSGSYRIDCEKYSPDGPMLISSSNLASGNAFDLLGGFKDWDEQGAYSVSQHPSRYSSTLLGLPPKEGWLIRARLHLDVEVSSGERWQTSDEGIPFHFEWRYPSEQGFEAMELTLRKLMKTPESESNRCHASLLGTLLELPELSQRLLLPDILDAIDIRSGGFDGREALVDHLALRRDDHPKIKEHYLQLLHRRDNRACEDLRRNDGLWDSRFITPLVSMHKHPHNTPPFEELSVLFQHQSEWANDATICQRLSAPLLKTYGFLLCQSPEQLIESEQLRSWSSYLSNLSHTRDRSALRHVVPFLDCRALVVDERFAAMSERSMPILYRACDCALHAVLVILDGQAEQAYRDAGFTPNAGFGRAQKMKREDVDALHDRMIELVKKRLVP